MASRIQGITVEIGGDTTKLSKALESVNKSIKGTQSGLKDVNKLLKLDPSNTELVVQKQKMLKDAIEATKEKLATLKTAAQQANEQLANGEITQQQYDALQREIVETEQNLRSLQDQAATTNATLAKIDEAGEKLQNIGSSVENVGKKFLPVTAAVTGLGTAAVKTAADFDSEMSKVSAISGATGDDFDQLRAKAREMGAKTKFSASEAASAMEYMAMAGWKTSDMLNGIEGVMNLAAASGEDLATTSDIVTDALTAFGLSAADSGHFADILAAASSNANTNVSMMGETFKYCAPIAGALGFSAEDTAEAIGLMANSGIKASQAGTSLRTIMNNLSGEVTFAGKNIGEVTIATSNADGSMRSLNDILADCRVAFSGLTESEKASNAEALVGKNAMSGFLALMNSSETDINKLRGAIENCDGASESMAETMQDNLNGQLTILKSQLEELAISFGDILMPTIRKIVSAVQQFVDKLNSILACVSMAQFILESGYGKSELAQNANNCFGMKTSLSGNSWSGSSWDGKSVYPKKTQEQNTDGSYVTITADFRKYACVEDSIADHAAYLLGAMSGSRKRYEGLAGCTDYKKAAQIIKDGGYATSHTYVQNLCNIIERWNLTQYDAVKDSESTTISGWYRVRKSWQNAASQKGAFHDLTYAKQCADKNPGYYVFDPAGKAVYPEPKSSVPYTVRVSIKDLNIRKGPGTNYGKTGYYTGKGVFTIVAESAGAGSAKGWGKLKSGAGWIALDFAARI